MIICASCSRENEDHYKFCLGCGGNLDDQREADGEAEPDEPHFCPSCGANISSGQRFCGSCGFKVEGVLSGASKAIEAKAPKAAKPSKAAKAPARTRAKAAGKTASKATAKTAARSTKAPRSAPRGAARSRRSAGDGAVGKLIMINPDGSPGDTFDLHPGPNEVGRSVDAEIFSRDPYLSPLHATFTVDGARVHVKDEGSLNGVFYRITEITELQHGDLIRVGQELLRFQLIELADTDIAPGTDGTVVAGSSPAGAWGKLERFSAPDEASIIFLLRGVEQVLGRERGDILFRDDGYVSGKHARIFMDSGRCFIEDLKSSNGTFLRIRAERDLMSGALILLGQQPFRVQLD